MPSYYSSSFASILIAALSTPAFAQEGQPAAGTTAVAERQGVISYTPADFAVSRPNTALEMINRLPGFTFESNDQVRGFAGAAGNVLIDGQRPTIKTDSLADTLGRIPIDQVERIEVIRGSVPGIDMQGQTVVANVVRKKADTFQQVLGVRSFLFAKTGKTIPGVNYSATRRIGEDQFEFGFSRGVSMDDSVGSGWRTTVDPVTGGLDLYENSLTEGDGFSHALRGSYKGSQLGGTLSVNGLISHDEFKNEQRFRSTMTDEQYVSRSANKRGEVGVNYITTLAPGLEWETLGLFKLSVGTLDATGLAHDPLGVDPDASQLFQIEAEAGERIGRSILRYTMSPELSFEGGGEIAYNYRDQQVALSVNGTPQMLDASDVLVEELRGELFGQVSWRPSKHWSLEAGLRVEQSTIEQSGQIEKERSFTYPKPRLLASWSPTDDDQVRLRIEREVGQLNFQDFASEVDLNTGVQDTGNSDLEPNKSWVYEAAYEKRFWEGAAAVLTLRHEDISDVVDVFPRRVDVDTDNDGTPDTEVFVSGPGNIGDGTTDVVSFNLTLPLNKIGIKGAEVKIESLWQNSEVTDPLTGEKRRISGQRPEDINLSYRHDLPEYNLTFGLGWYQGWRETYYQGTSVESLKLRDFYSSFVEWKPDPGFTLRAELNNFDPYSFDIERRVYTGPRDTDPLGFIETERRNSQAIGLLSARWTFN
ncbi:MAG TPA: TonB-dependent receptor [Hyphomonadaceae bacterium]|nr:TonB-dependent receptor [Hyphomonadaceae bacterium]